eukprot:CAMPEP_0173388138 /NCGR_PEP_ID=MMETSP1356-20130122/10518_1 /TAXON_ID=77927 ORGANISM="Hemiselmis virescens, Strain PCC157" /NCGR_SAMPLE_ID=MMETSP1356 /ASSEMBLY_ACC=CAM_ASM_000847 /LENGTH=87 /DNA_ID=CAMNT_0014344967 /DNA_START=139 /DNA_END=398 /DNA_ORIENTATION=-
MVLRYAHVCCMGAMLTALLQLVQPLPSEAFSLGPLHHPSLRCNQGMLSGNGLRTSHCSRSALLRMKGGQEDGVPPPPPLPRDEVPPP